MGSNSTVLFIRGYTGHEHIGNGLELVNMNGRIYDPRLGRFMSPDPFVQQPGNSQSYNRYSYCINNPLKYTDKNGYWFGWDDLAAFSVGFAIGYFNYAFTTGNFGWKALGAGLISGVITDVGWNIMGPGKAAMNGNGGLGGASDFLSGLEAVFSSKGGCFGLQMLALTTINVSAHGRELTNADDKRGLGSLFQFAGYSSSAMLATSVHPFSVKSTLSWKAWSGVVLTDNISDNMKDGEFNFHSLHVGLIGYDFDRHDKNWGGIYTAFSHGLTDGQRFDMGFETITGLSLIKKDFFVNVKFLKRYNCGMGLKRYQPWIQLSKIGEIADRTYSVGNMVCKSLTGKSAIEYWESLHEQDW